MTIIGLKKANSDICQETVSVSILSKAYKFFHLSQGDFQLDHASRTSLATSMTCAFKLEQPRADQSVAFIVQTILHL